MCTIARFPRREIKARGNKNLQRPEPHNQTDRTQRAWLAETATSSPATNQILNCIGIGHPMPQRVLHWLTYLRQTATRPALCGCFRLRNQANSGRRRTSCSSPFSSLPYWTPNSPPLPHPWRHDCQPCQQHMENEPKSIHLHNEKAYVVLADWGSIGGLGDVRLRARGRLREACNTGGGRGESHVCQSRDSPTPRAARLRRVNSLANQSTAADVPAHEMRIKSADNPQSESDHKGWANAHNSPRYMERYDWISSSF